jgi:hypothetical protein
MKIIPFFIHFKYILAFLSYTRSMHIHSISKVLGLPIVLLTIGILYYTWSSNTQLSPYLVVPAILLVFLYVFHGPLDHWWLVRFPVPFEPKLKDWLEKYFLPYQKLDTDHKRKFEYRSSLYLDARLFKSVGSELRDVPEDIKLMVAAHGVYMCLALDDYLIGDMDRIFLYKHPFPTPEYPRLHTVETNIEDGVIILSLEQLTNAVLYPDDYYNIGFHAYAEAFVGVNDKILFPDCTYTWEKIEEISGWNKDTLLTQTGLEELSLLPVHITLFFTKTIQYQKVLPVHYERFCIIFNQRP